MSTDQGYNFTDTHTMTQILFHRRLHVSVIGIFFFIFLFLLIFYFIIERFNEQKNKRKICQKNNEFPFLLVFENFIQWILITFIPLVQFLDIPLLNPFNYFFFVLFYLLLFVLFFSSCLICASLYTLGCLTTTEEFQPTNFKIILTLYNLPTFISKQ